MRKPLAAGQLNKRIVIERPKGIQDDYGQMIVSWMPIHAVWAAVEPLQGREYWAAASTQAERTLRVRIRYLPGIDSALRVVCAGRVFAITAVIDPQEAHRELQLLCKENV